MPTATVTITNAWTLIATAVAGVKLKTDLGANVLISVNPTLPGDDTTAISYAPDGGSGYMSLPDLGSSNVYARTDSGSAKIRVVPMAVGSATQSAGLAGTGTTHHKVKAAASTNLTSIKSGRTKLYRYTLRNSTASAKYLKIFNKASAPVIATDTALLIETVIIPANGTASYLNPAGKEIASGLAYAITGALSETDTTNTAVDDVVGSFDYI